MDTDTKNIFDVILGFATLATVLVTGLWAWWRFLREGVHRPRIELDLECTFLGPQEGSFVAAFSIFAANKGHTDHRLDEMRLRVLGIRRGQEMAEWDKRRPLLSFPERIASQVDIIPPDYEYFFVRPGVRQRISYVMPIAEDFAFILARVTFRYAESDEVHTAERAFSVRSTGPGSEPSSADQLS